MLSGAAVGRGKQRGECLSRVGLRAGSNGLGRPGCHDPSTTGSALGTQVDHPVSGFDNVEIVLDHQHRVSFVDETVQHVQQLADVGEVQAGGGFVEQVDGVSGRSLAQFSGQLDALSLASGEGRGGLPELEIIESHFAERAEQTRHLRVIAKMFESFLHVHLENFGDVLRPEPDFQRLVVKSSALADRARDPDVGQEVHLEPGRPVTLARFTPAALDVEAESTRLVAACPCLGQLTVEITNAVEQLDVRGGIGAWRAADGRLVDVDGPIEMLESGHPAMRTRLALAGVEFTVEHLPEDVVGQ